MSYGKTASGLQCAWGSKLDTAVPRPKMPKCALPPDVRAKMGLSVHAREEAKETKSYFASGSGVLEQRGAATDGYSAGNQKHFLKRRSGAHMSERTRSNRVYSMTGDALVTATGRSVSHSRFKTSGHTATSTR
ncbi:unnamed protein product [Amoebophrya sp. A120]|nr:unnamed protein product [Amoebophrya sp. A120]|eukprot:GSA120T00001957001.1